MQAVVFCFCSFISENLEKTAEYYQHFVFSLNLY
jgi:hypothetical protein